MWYQINYESIWILRSSSVSIYIPKTLTLTAITIKNLDNSTVPHTAVHASGLALLYYYTINKPSQQYKSIQVNQFNINEVMFQIISIKQMQSIN